MTRREFCKAVMERAGGRCEWPDCCSWGDHAAHIHHAGMGGSPRGDRHTTGNGWFLCRYHHDLFDGRSRFGYQRPLRELAAAYLRLAREET